MKQDNLQKNIQAKFKAWLKERLNTDDDQKVLEYLSGLDKNKQKKLIDEFRKEMTLSAAHGAKLQYFKSLKHKCADDEEVVYYKKGGGLVDCGCKKKGGEIKDSNSKKNSTIDEFKKRLEEAKKKREAEKNIPNYPPQGSNKTNRFWAEKINKDKLHKNDYKDTKDETTPPNINKGIGRNKKGGEIKKDCGGSSIVKKFKSARCGAKVKKHEFGGSLNRIPFMQTGTFKGGVQFKEDLRKIRKCLETI